MVDEVPHHAGDIPRPPAPLKDPYGADIAPFDHAQFSDFESAPEAKEPSQWRLFWEWVRPFRWWFGGSLIILILGAIVSVSNLFTHVDTLRQQHTQDQAAIAKLQTQWNTLKKAVFAGLQAQVCDDGEDALTLYWPSGDTISGGQPNNPGWVSVSIDFNNQIATWKAAKPYHVSAVWYGKTDPFTGQIKGTFAPDDQRLAHKVTLRHADTLVLCVVPNRQFAQGSPDYFPAGYQP